MDKDSQDWLRKLGIAGAAIYGGLGLFAGLAGLINFGREAGVAETEAMRELRKAVTEHAREALSHREHVQSLEILRAAYEDADGEIDADIRATFGEELRANEWLEKCCEARFSSVRNQRHLRKAMDRHSEFEHEHRRQAERLHAEYQRLKAEQTAIAAEEERQIKAVRELCPGHPLDSCVDCRNVKGGPYRTATHFVLPALGSMVSRKELPASLAPTLCAEHAAFSEAVAATALLELSLEGGLP